MRLRSLIVLLSSFLILPVAAITPDIPEYGEDSDSLTFSLRQSHAVDWTTGTIFWSDVDSSESHLSSAPVSAAKETYTVQTMHVQSYKSNWESTSSYSRHRDGIRDRQHILAPAPLLPLWEEDDILAPNTSSRKTLLELAKMTNNAYAKPGDQRWYDLGQRWNNSHQIGWHPDEDGFRGHVFATPDNETVVLSIKGTSIAGLFSSGPTVVKDKLNDNLLFSCCCARVGWTWTTVCGCYEGGWRCGQDCLEQSLVEGDGRFYPVGIDLYNNLTYMYPHSNIWVIGHSLGGALASLIGATFGTPIVAFESPGEKMAASRLHLPSPPSTHHITHVYHTADPIAMGTCNGVLSACALGGYAMESKCHLGKTIVYDTIAQLSWSSDIRTHPIAVIIEQLLSVPWEASEQEGQEVPKAVIQDDCVECYKWDFVE